MLVYSFFHKNTLNIFSVGFAVGAYSPTDRILDFDLVHSVTLPLSTEIRTGAPGQSGPLEASFSGKSPLFQLAAVC